MNRILIVSLAALSLSIWIAGCGGNGENQPAAGPAAPTAQEDHDHGTEAESAHPTEGPHGGHLVELGDEQYHAELVHDEASHTVSVYLLDAAGKAPVPIHSGTVTLQLFQGGKFVDYALKPVGDPGAAGAAEFAVVSEPLTDALLHAENVRGRLHVTIDGKQYTGIVEHAAHEHAGHEH